MGWLLNVSAIFYKVRIKHFVHAFPLRTNARQRRTVLTKDTQKNETSLQLCQWDSKKSPWKSQGLLNTKPWGNRYLWMARFFVPTVFYLLIVLYCRGLLLELKLRLGVINSTCLVTLVQSCTFKNITNVSLLLLGLVYNSRLMFKYLL